jgi:type VI secretion system FHA domain protein
MPLTLKVLSFKGQPASQSAIVIDEQGGTIGRSEGNTLVLPDPEKFVSRQHATISVKNGLYYLTDCSLSGVFINDEESALHSETRCLTDGMSLRIGDYEIAVSIDAVQASEFFVFDQPDITPENNFFLGTNDFGNNRLMSEHSSPFVKHEELIQTTDDKFEPSFESQLQGSSVLFDNFIAPAVSSDPFANDEIPEGFSFEDLLAESPRPASVARETVNAPATSEPKPIKQQAAAPSLPDTALFDAFLQGTSVFFHSSQTDPPSNTLYRVGQMFRHLIMGTVAVLRNRTQFKSNLHLDRTLIQAADNNPLKFAITPDEVIRNFLDNKTDGFLGSIEAIDQGFDDMISHQLAMQAGIEAAVADLLDNLNPANVEKQIDQGIVLQKKAKCWDKYEEIYRYTSEATKENFFGAAFADAYEQKIKELAKRHYR